MTMLRVALCVLVAATAAWAQRGPSQRPGPRPRPSFPRPGGVQADVRPDNCGKYQCPAYTTQSIDAATELRAFTAETWWATASEVKSAQEAEEQMAHRGPRGGPRPGASQGQSQGQGGPVGEMGAKIREMIAKVGTGENVGNGEMLKFFQSRMAKGGRGRPDGRGSPGGRGRGRPGRPGGSGMRGMFGKLFRYINGANALDKKMPMTIPVPKKFEPQADGSMKLTMQFYLAEADRPAPTDGEVVLAARPQGQQFYVRSFLVQRDDAVRGPQRFKQELQALRDALTAAGRPFNKDSFYKV